MKRCEILLLASLSAAMICSCDSYSESGYSYDIINGDLVLKTADGKNFLKYNDDADYSIFLEDVFFSSEILHDDEFKSNFNSVSDKVKAINNIDFVNFHEEDIDDKLLAEIAAKHYYDLRDKIQFYEGESRYGHQKYYIEEDCLLTKVISVFDFIRSKDNPHIPDGAVIVRIGAYIGEYDETEFSLALCGGMKKMLEF